MPRVPRTDRSGPDPRRDVGPRPPSRDLLREAFHRRAVEAIDRLTDTASPEALADALSAPTGAGAVARLLSDAAALGAAGELEPLASSVARGAEAKADLVRRSGGLLTGAQMGKVLGGISRQAVDKRRRAGQLLAVHVGADWRYPAVQADRDGNVLDGLAGVIQAMRDVGPWATLDFLLAPESALGGLTPLNALKRGGAAAETVHRLVTANRSDAYS